MDETLAQRVRSLIERAPPTRRAVLEAGILRLAIHRRQTIRQWHYIELCPNYLRTMVSCCYETARQAWQELREAIGWWQVPWKRIEALGGQLRRLKRGERHGQHLLVDQAHTKTFRMLAEELQILEHTPGGQVEWISVQPKRRGRHLVCPCPFHDDHDPSMILNPTGVAWCFACRTAHRYDPTGPSVSSATKATEPAPAQPRRPSSTIENPLAEIPAVGGWVVGSLGPHGIRTRPVGGDLIGALKEGERQSRRAREPVGALMADEPRRMAPDLLAHLDDVRVSKWERRRGRWRPVLVPVAVRFIGVDIDDIAYPPLVPPKEALSELRTAGVQIEQWAREHPELSGRVSVVRTGLHGVQVVLELAEPKLPEWRRTDESEQLHDEVDAFVVAAVGWGGKPDPSIRAAGRLVRRPGPRVTKQRQAYVSRLAYVS